MYGYHIPISRCPAACVLHMPEEELSNRYDKLGPLSDRGNMPLQAWGRRPRAIINGCLGEPAPKTVHSPVSVPLWVLCRRLE